MKTDKIQAFKQIFAAVDHGDEAYRVVEGSVEISILEDGQKLVLALLGAGEIFGEMAMIESPSFGYRTCLRAYHDRSYRAPRFSTNSR
jgi:CRP-like cAMP-binding protein